MGNDQHQETKQINDPYLNKFASIIRQMQEVNPKLGIQRKSQINFSIKDIVAQDRARGIKEIIDIQTRTSETKIALQYALIYVEENPYDAMGFAQLGFCYLLSKDKQKALLNFFIALAINERCTFTLYGCGLLFFFDQDYEISIRYFDLLLDCKQDYPDALFYTGKCHMEMKRYEQACIFFDRTIKANNKYDEAYYCKAETLIQMNKTEQAIQLIDSIAYLFPNPQKYYQLKASAYSKCNREETALIYFKKSIHLNSSLKEYLFNLGLSYSNLKRYQESNHYLQWTVRVQPDEAPAYSLMAKNYMSLGQLQLAINCLKKALDINPKNVKYLLELAYVFIKTEQLNKAQEILGRASQLGQESSELHQHKANYFANKGQYQKSIQSYLRALQLNQQSDQLHYELGLLYYKLGKIKLAEESLKISIKISKTIQGLIVLGNCYIRQKLYTQSIQICEQIFDLILESSDIYDYLKHAFQVIERLEKIHLFDKILNSPSNKWSKTVYYERLYKRLIQLRANSFILNLVYQELTVDNKDYYCDMIAQQEIGCANQLKDFIISIYETKCTSKPSLRKIIILLFIYARRNNYAKSKKYFTQLLHFSKSTQPLDHSISDCQRFLSVFRQDCCDFQSKTQTNILEISFWHFLRQDQRDAAFCFNFIKKHLNDPLIEHRLVQEINNHQPPKISRINTIIQSIMIKGNLFIRQIDFSSLNELSQSAILQKIEFIQQYGESTGNIMTFEKFIKSLNPRVKALISASRKAKRIQKADEKLFAYLMKSEKIRGEVEGYNVFFPLISAVQKDYGTIKQQILDQLNKYLIKQGLIQFEQLMSFIGLRIIPFLKQSYAYNEFIIHIINQLGYLLIECLPEKAAKLAKILNTFQSDKSWQKLKESLGNLHSEYEQMNFDIQNPDVEEKHLDLTSKNVNRKTQLRLVIEKHRQKQTPLIRLVNQGQNSSSVLTSFLNSESISDSSQNQSSFQRRMKHLNRTDRIFFIKDISSLPCIHTIIGLDIFKSLLLINHYHIISFISKEQPSLIAHHSIQNDMTIMKGIQIKEFTFSVVRGEHEFSQKQSMNSNKEQLEILMSMGKRIVYCWMMSAAQMIAKFQELGFFQADFQIRNTIKLGETFKAIDFDYSFQVMPADIGIRRDMFATTCQILKYWLDQAYQSRQFYDQDCQSFKKVEDTQGDRIIEYIFKNASCSTLDRLKKIKKRFPLPHQRLTQASKVQECLKLLHQHMKHSHYQQLQQICQRILSYQKLNMYSYWNCKEKDQIQNIMTQLGNHSDYMLFSTNLQQIYEKYEQDHKWNKLRLGIRDQFIGIYCQGLKVKTLPTYKMLLAKMNQQMISFLSKVKSDSIITYLQGQIVEKQQYIGVYASAIYDYQQIRSKQEIFQRGASGICVWIISLAKIMMELFDLGIYCSNISVQNIVRFGQQYKWKAQPLSYKFKSGKVKGNEYQDSYYAATLQLMAELIRSSQTDRKEIIKEILPGTQSQFMSIMNRIYMAEGPIEERAVICLKERSHQLINDHFEQFKRIALDAVQSEVFMQCRSITKLEKLNLRSTIQGKILRRSDHNYHKIIQQVEQYYREHCSTIEEKPF